LTQIQHPTQFYRFALPKRLHIISGNTRTVSRIELELVKAPGARQATVVVEEDVAIAQHPIEVLISVDHKLSQLCRISSTLETDFEMVGSNILASVAFEKSHPSNHRVSRKHLALFHHLETAASKRRLLDCLIGALILVVTKNLVRDFID